MSWHVEPDAVQDYVDQRRGGAFAASIEAHLVTCADCRRLVADHTHDPLLDLVWQRVTATIDTSHVPVTERLLSGLGVSHESARLVAATSRARMAFLFASMLTVAIALIAAHSHRDTQFGMFLTVAALGPLAATGLAFGRRVDPAYELVTTAPTSAWRILLLRTAAASVPALAVTGVASLVLHDRGWTAMAWLLPGVAMAVVSLALSTWVPVEYAAISVGAAWVIVPIATRLPSSRLIEIAAGPLQELALVVAAAGTVIVSNRRSFLDFREA